MAKHNEYADIGNNIASIIESLVAKFSDGFDQKVPKYAEKNQQSFRKGSSQT